MLGHQLAVEQLRDIEHATGGALEVLSIREPPEGQLLARIELSITCGGIPHTLGGLRLRERERFILLTSNGFPFEVPSLWVPHTRFAGYPHVQWKHSLCL